MNDPHWSQVINACGTLIIGIFVAYVAWRQHQNAKEKLRLDLFERRYTIFEYFEYFKNVLFIEGKVTPESLSSLERARYGSRFLFKGEIYNLMSEICITASNYKRYRLRYESISKDSPNEEETFKKYHHEEDKLYELSKNVEKYFEEYLAFR